jgi:glycosyltransferase involved in cell wall biosynthesis
MELHPDVKCRDCRKGVVMSTAAVIPTRNRCELLAGALDSVAAQTLPVTEIIVVDDGSSDSTASMLASRAQRDPRITVLRNERSVGAAAARNVGVARALSDWIAFLDCDDSWSPHKHERQFEALTRNPEAIACFSGYRMVFSDRIHSVGGRVSFSEDELRAANVIGTTSSAMIRREKFLEVGGFDPNLPSCQDWDLWLRLNAMGEFAIVPECLVDFNQGSPNRISRDLDAVIEGHKVVFGRALTGVSTPGRRRKIRAGHYRRLSHIYTVDIPRPMRALGHSLLANLQWPDATSRKRLWEAARHAASPLKRGAAAFFAAR